MKVENYFSHSFLLSCEFLRIHFQEFSLKFQLKHGNKLAYINSRYGLNCSKSIKDSQIFKKIALQ
jgi:hypothetical protein